MPEAGQAATGDPATVKAFLSAGVPAAVRDKRSGATPLHGAAVEGPMVMIEYLFSKGADVNAHSMSMETRRFKMRCR